MSRAIDLKMYCDLGTGFGHEPVVKIGESWFAEKSDGLHFRRFLFGTDRYLLDSNSASSISAASRLVSDGVLLEEYSPAQKEKPLVSFDQSDGPMVTQEYLNEQFEKEKPPTEVDGRVWCDLCGSFDCVFDD